MASKDSADPKFALKASLRVCLWGRMVSCAPIGNRRKVGRLTIGPQDTILPHNQIDPLVLTCPSMRPFTLGIVLLFACLPGVAGQNQGSQNKKPPSPSDYGQWETLVSEPRSGGLSPDGKWLAYGINRSNGNNELRLARITGEPLKPIPFASQPAFSADSRWVAYAIGYSEAQQDKLRKDKKPVHSKLGLTNLTTGEQSEIEGIESFAFSPSGTFLAMRRYPPEKAPSASPGDDAAATAEDENPAGATVIVRNLANGRDITLGTATEYVWQDLRLKGHLLAVSIATPDKTGSGVQLFDTSTGTLRVLDSSSSVYSGLAWRKDAADLAALRSKTDEKREGPTQIVLAWKHLGESSESVHQFDPGAGTQFPAGMRIVAYRKPSWSADGADVFCGIAKWDEKPPKPKEAPKDGSKDPDPSKAGDAAKEPEEQASVDIWHWRDIDVQPKQKKGAEQDRHRNLLAVWHVDQNQFVQLGRELLGQVTPLKHQNAAYSMEWKAYAMDRSIGRPAADLYLVDLATGKPTRIQERLLDDRYLQASPGGRYLLYLQDDHYWTVNVATHAVVNITKNVKTSFVDRESDFTIKQLPPFGVAGWTKDDRDVILYDKFDMWRISPDGARATRLTDGTAEQIRHRYDRLDPDEEFIDTEKPVYVSLFGIWTKKSGYALLNLKEPGTPELKRLIWEDKRVDRLGKAKDADVYAYVMETFEESPNVFVGSPALTGAKRVTSTNTFQANYAWSHSELIEYKSSKGQRLQGALYYPAAYETGRKYPLIVYLYEKLSDGLHRYSPLSERSYYNPSAITSHDYFLLMPDIVFRPREPGLSVAECVTAALKEVLAKGMVDEKKIGVVGHSWGGFDSAFLATHTTLFAAAVAGAPITDLISNYGNHHWSSGIAETDHIETGQQRMVVPLYEDLEAYIRNSAVFNVANMTTPLLIEVGDSDGTVFFHQGVELYNIARRARKNVVLLEYAGEDHGLRKKADQIDYQRRIFAWFGHYLKDEPAAPWITDGESYLDRQRELKKAKAKAGS
jgi:dipeptidyl aminopeptidase/acylaminoacyl peptidase